MTSKPWALAVLALFWVLAAALLPPVQDEAYYFGWATHLALGYFDHPPLVAWMAATSRLADGCLLLDRLGTLLVAGLLLASTVRFFRIIGLSDDKVRFTAMLLAFGNVMGLAVGFLTTPDTALMLAWILALSEAALALKGDDKRWLTAGAATGLGLLAKYTMLLMGPVFLWALLRTSRGRGLRTPWPYLGGVLALLVFSPNLLWNAQNDWITLRFQARHGFAMARPDLDQVPRLPVPAEATVGSTEWQIAQPFRDLEEVTQKEEKRPGPYDDVLKAANRYVGFYGSQIGLWGALLFVFPLFWRRRKREALTAAEREPTPNTLEEPFRTLVLAALVTPLILFGILSLFSKVEANWSAMYVFAAAVLLAPKFARRPRLTLAAVAVNLVIVAVAVAQARTGFLPTRPHRDRLLAETHGYADLAATVAGLEGPVFAANYQLTAMTRFYRPDLETYQWPGLTRDSEYLRNPAWTGISTADLQRTGKFWLLLSDLDVPVLAGFKPSEMAQLRDCKGEGLQVISEQAAALAAIRCKKPIHEWYLVRYVVEGP